MSAGLDSPNLNRLIDLIEKLGPIKNHDAWLGKRQHRRVEMVLPVRLRLFDEQGNTQGPAFAARSRDVSEQGLGLTVPSNLGERRHFKVEMFTIIGSLVGRMETLHCTQTNGGYKIGMRWIEAPLGRTSPQRPGQSSLSLSMAPGKPQSEILTFKQALEEIRQAMRKYYVASISRGLLGLSMEREIGRVIESLPAQPDADIKAEPRRKAFRHEVEGQVHLMVSTPQGHEFSSNDIADFSKGGARVVIMPPRAVETFGKPPEALPWSSGTSVSLGMWTQTGTLWLPARVTHCDQRSDELILAGLQFTLDKVMKDFA